MLSMSTIVISFKDEFFSFIDLNQEILKHRCSICTEVTETKFSLVFSQDGIDSVILCDMPTAIQFLIVGIVSVHQK